LKRIGLDFLLFSVATLNSFQNKTDAIATFFNINVLHKNHKNEILLSIKIRFLKLIENFLSNLSACSTPYHGQNWKPVS